jgi:phosphocarrier protein
MADPSVGATSPTPRQERRVRIQNRAGMHARPAAAFVKTAAQFRCRIHVARNELEVDARSIMGVLMLAAEQGAELRISAVGEDAEAALEALVALVAAGFGEGDEVL